MSTMTADETHVVRLKAANAKRLRLAMLKRHMRDDYATARAAILDPPADLIDTPLVEVIVMARKNGMTPDSLDHLGEIALKDGVHLLRPVGRVSTRERRWAVEHGLKHARLAGRPRLQPERVANGGPRLYEIAARVAEEIGDGEMPKVAIRKRLWVDYGIATGAADKAIERAMEHGLLVRVRFGWYAVKGEA